jgi:hypothetical protein
MSEERFSVKAINEIYEAPFTEEEQRLFDRVCSLAQEAKAAGMSPFSVHKVMDDVAGVFQVYVRKDVLDA